MSLEDELSYQAEEARKIDPQPLSQETIARYRKTAHWRYYFLECVFHLLGDVSGKTVFDFGCGDGGNSLVLASMGAMTTGMDISPDLIEVARRRARLQGVNINFSVGDIRDTHPGKFDAIVCVSVLHHVDLDAVLPRLLACARPGSTVVIVEPVNLSPTLRAIRLRLPVPVHGSPDEAPLTADRVARVLSSLRNPQCHYFDLTARLQRVLGQWIAPVTTRVDRILLSIFPFLKKFCAVVVICGQANGRV